MSGYVYEVTREQLRGLSLRDEATEIEHRADLESNPPQKTLDYILQLEQPHTHPMPRAGYEVTRVRTSAIF